MKRIVLACALLLPCLACLALADDNFIPPKTATPALYVVRALNKEKNEITLMAVVGALEADKSKADKLKPPPPPKIKRQPLEFAVSLRGFNLLTANGKELDEKEAWQRLKVGQALVVASDPKGIDPVFRQILRPETLVLVPEIPDEAGPNAVKPPRETKAEQPARRTGNSRAFLGRWDITVQSADGPYPSWLEVRRSGKTLVGEFVGQFGSVRPISRVETADRKVHFSVPPQFELGDDDLVFTGRLEDGALRGEGTDDRGRRFKWTAKRAPSLKRARPPTWGEPIELFNGKDLTGWTPRNDKVKNGWTVRDGLLVNAHAGNDLVTEGVVRDFKLHAEFRYPKGSNSGIYLRGRYEVQIEDNYGDEPDCHKVAGVYGFLTPSVNAAKKPGEWQTMDITLVGRVVTVVFNGERVIDRQTIPGITGGALDSDEGAPGPILLQGDHGAIEFRKVTLTPES
jgi:hypothetical protein